MGLLRKLENSRTALSPCVWRDKADSSCSNNHAGGGKKAWNLPITGVTINNLVFAMNLVQINRQRGGRPRALHNLESELAEGAVRLQLNFTCVLAGKRPKSW